MKSLWRSVSEDRVVWRDHAVPPGDIWVLIEDHDPCDDRAEEGVDGGHDLPYEVSHNVVSVLSLREDERKNGLQQRQWRVRSRR